MIIIITGSRGLAVDTADSFGKEFSRVSQTLWDALCRDDLMIFGDARGVDTGAYEFAVKHKVPHEIWYAEWNKLTAPGAVIRKRQNGSEYNLMAGYDRNQKMIDRALELSGARRERIYCIAMWDEISKGTLDCMKRALAANIEVVCWNPKTRKHVGIEPLKDE